MRYQLTPLCWTPVDDDEGRNAYDYLRAMPPKDGFETEEAAGQWLDENYLGDDEFGVGIEWVTEEVTA